MKKASTIFLQIVIVIVGIAALVFLLWEPHLEGRNKDATWFQVYFKDPFLAYAYTASIAFFIGLFQGFKVLGFVRNNTMFTPAAVKALRTIKYCALAIIAFLIGGEAFIIFYVRQFEEDIAGGVAMGLFFMVASIIIAAGAATFEKIFQKGVDLQSENELTV